MPAPRRIAVVTTSRADYGIFRPVIREMQARRELDVKLLVTGSHLSSHHGMTVREIEADGFPIGARVPALKVGDTAKDISEAIGNTAKGFGEVYARNRPDIVLVLGDRFEMFAAALASVPFAIPLAHLHGGEMTLGAFDDALRHALTKLSHIHFVSANEYRRRVVQMGERPDHVLVTGAPALDAIRSLVPLKREELSERLGLTLDSAPLLVTYHPETLSGRPPAADVKQLLRAMRSFRGPIVITGTNADVGGSEIGKAMHRFTAEGENRRYVVNLGSQAYFSLMKVAAAVVGNSSSGIIEAASFAIPVVNVGDRQAGRMRPKNVIDCDCQTTAIMEALRQALSKPFRRKLTGMKNPYGDGHAASRIAKALANVSIAPELIRKGFRDIKYSMPKS